MSDLHKKLIAVRKKCGLSQLATAELANIPLRTYQRLESGQTSASVDYLERIAAAHQCSVDDLLYFDLKSNQFDPPRPVEHTALVHEKNLLEAENHRLRRFVSHLLDLLPGGQRAQNEVMALQKRSLRLIGLSYPQFCYLRRQ